MRGVNGRLLRDIGSSDFVTVFLGVLDLDANRTICANAGHLPPYVVRGAGGAVSLRRTGLPLGPLDDAAWGEKTVDLERGDVLVLCTDGVTDRESPDGMFCGHERLVEAVRAALGGSARAM